MPSILVTGANRALGLEWVRQYAEKEWQVYATCRHPAEATALLALRDRHPNISIHRMDVTLTHEIEAVAVELSGRPIDRLISNAGVYYEKYQDQGVGRLRFSDFEATLAVNTIAPLRLAEAFEPHLARAKNGLFVAISSHMGSIAEIQAPGDYFYRASKAALNAAMKGLAVEWQTPGIGVLMLHPGWVQTRMGGPGAVHSPEESVAAMAEVIGHYKAADSGRFLRYDGNEIPW